MVRIIKIHNEEKKVLEVLRRFRFLRGNNLNFRLLGY